MGLSNRVSESGSLLDMLRRVRRKLRGDAPYLMSENPAYSKYEIGEGSYGYPEIAFYDSGAKLRIGKYCSIAPRVTILLGGEHHHDWVGVYPFSLLNPAARDLPGYPFTKGDVVIGNDVWIGYEALILSGVTIGNGAVIGARSLITKDVEPYSIVGGIPARLLRRRFTDEQIAALQEIAWWDWHRDQIQKEWRLIQGPNVDSFIRTFRADKIEATI